MISVRAVIGFCDRNGVSLLLFNSTVSDICDWLQNKNKKLNVMIAMQMEPHKMYYGQGLPFTFDVRM